MNPGILRALLDRHRARLLGRWREGLRALPPSSALAAPDLLLPLMAPALARVREEAGRSLAAAGEDAAVVAAHCPCGLNPLTAFYLTGECATFDVLWSRPDALARLPAAEREAACRALTQAWRRVAADEIALFCGACRRGAGLAAKETGRPLSASGTGGGPPAPCRPSETRP